MVNPNWISLNVGFAWLVVGFGLPAPARYVSFTAATFNILASFLRFRR